ncbi:hypothetical protein GCM10027347_21010 [Larkinella harenae]
MAQVVYTNEGLQSNNSDNNWELSGCMTAAEDFAHPAHVFGYSWWVKFYKTPVD